MVADLESFLTDSSQFYSDLINVCQKTYQFDLQKFISDGDFTFDSKTERNRVIKLYMHMYMYMYSHGCTRKCPTGYNYIIFLI